MRRPHIKLEDWFYCKKYTFIASEAILYSSLTLILRQCQIGAIKMC